DLVGAQEVRRDLEPRDELELPLDLSADTGRDAGRVAHPAAILDEAAQRLVGGFARAAERVARKGVAELAEREAAARGHVERRVDPARLVAEERGDLLGRAEVRLGVGGEPGPGFVERRLVADAVHDVGERLARRLVEERARAGDDRNAESGRR